MLRIVSLVAGALLLPACSASDASAPGEAQAAAPHIAEVKTLLATDLVGMVERGEIVLIDVRSPEEFAEGRIPGALNAPIETFDPQAIPIESGRETILYCRSGNRSGRAAAMLVEYTGGDQLHLHGGIIAWEEAGGAIIGAASAE